MRATGVAIIIYRTEDIVISKPHPLTEAAGAAE
jgi:hypothetical protein